MIRETWDCAVCGKIIKQSWVWEQGRDGRMVEIRGDSDLTTPLNPFNPDSLYWNPVHNMVFCGPVHSLIAHEQGYQI